MSKRALLIASLVLGGLGTIGMIIGFITDPTQAAFSYLTAWVYAVSIALGALIFLMIAHATQGKWFIVFRRFGEMIVASLPILALAFIPIALELGRIYVWVHPPATLDHEALATIAHKAPYLNPTFFIVRTAIFFAFWIAIAGLLTRFAARSDRDVPAHLYRLRALACGALPAVALTLTFASFDWLMSMTPLWYSTVFGLLYFSGGFVAALAAIAVIARNARRVPAVAEHIHPSHTGAIGRLLFAFLVFWAYMEFSQGLIIWIANKPGEVPWYVTRGAGAWGSMFAVLLIGHFALPFFVLLAKPLKRKPTPLALVGWWLLLMHYVDIYWIVMPILHPAFSLHWLDVAAPLAVVGLSTAFAVARSRGPIATDDPRFPLAVRYEGS